MGYKVQQIFFKFNWLSLAVSLFYLILTNHNTHILTLEKEKRQKSTQKKALIT